MVKNNSLSHLQNKMLEGPVGNACLRHSTYNIDVAMFSAGIIFCKKKKKWCSSKAHPYCSLKPVGMILIQCCGEKRRIYDTKNFQWPNGGLYDVNAVNLFTILLARGQKYYNELLVPRKLAETLHLVTITMKPKIYMQSLLCREKKYTLMHHTQLQMIQNHLH